MRLAAAILYAYGTSEGAEKGWESRLSHHGYKLDKYGTSNGKLYRVGSHSVHVKEGGFHYENASTGEEKSGNIENLAKVLDQVHK